MAAASVLALGGCSSQIADLQQADAPADPSVDRPANASSQPSQVGTYLPVEDSPSGSDEDVITPQQRAKIEAELIAARDRQAVALQNAQAK
ncbi:MAG: hypothetical protein ACRECL_17020 [Bradyrhizobium sp.]